MTRHRLHARLRLLEDRAADDPPPPRILRRVVSGDGIARRVVEPTGAGLRELHGAELAELGIEVPARVAPGWNGGAP